jgi:pimeloyl-ACP methyl ester carboxylesterase
MCLIVGNGCASLINMPFVDCRGHGCTFVLPGIEGAEVGHLGFMAGLKSGGVGTEIELVDWTTQCPALMLYHLRGLERNRMQARQIAQRIVDYQQHFPGYPVNLIGHSGGAGVALLTLEELPADHQVDSVILLSGAMSSVYDLRPVFPKIKRGIFNYSSPIGDSLLLGALTRVFGTIDGHHCTSIGVNGFKFPANATPEERLQYFRKLFERRYELSMAFNGNLSDHFGPLNPLFARNELAPILCSEALCVRVATPCQYPGPRNDGSLD